MSLTIPGSVTTKPDPEVLAWVRRWEELAWKKLVELVKTYE